MANLTRFEMTRLISARALQLSLGAPSLVKLPKDPLTAEDIAKLEIKEGVIPMAVLREFPDGSIKRIEITGA